MSVFKLNLHFKLAQARLIDMGMKYGLQDPRTIAQSHKVDKLHAELQRRVAR